MVDGRWAGRWWPIDRGRQPLAVSHPYPPSESPGPESKIGAMVIFRSLAVAALSLVAVPLLAQDLSTPAQGQPALPTVTVCGTETAPRAQPPAGTGPVVLFIAPCFEAQGNASVIE